MNQFSEADVRLALEPFHHRIRRVIERGYAEWLLIKRLMADNGIGPVLYPRTVANFVFDAVVRHAKLEFSEDGDVRVIENSQTVKFCFGDMVLARFKKGDEDHLGQNQPTQAVLDFVCAQGCLPGFPPEAAKVEILYSATEIEDGIERVVVVARDGDDLLWHYDLDDLALPAEIIPFPERAAVDDDSQDEGIVTTRPLADEESDGESD